jgi:phosphoglycerate kinase
MSHLGRPKDGPTEKYSLKHIVAHLSKVLGVEVQFANDCIGAEAVDKAAALQPGQVLLLENLRFYKEEEKGEVAFAEKLSKLGDVYVNDAFGTAHRAHASTAIIAQFFTKENRTFGLVMEGEVVSAEKVLHAAQKPFTAIIGGAKVSDKILIIENLLDRATDIIIGGGMAYTFFKAQGGKIGNSIHEDDRMPLALEILAKAKAKGVNIHLPIDNIIADDFSNDAKTQNCASGEIPDGESNLLP